jgi:hypothetical protein
MAPPAPFLVPDVFARIDAPDVQARILSRRDQTDFSSIASTRSG